MRKLFSLLAAVLFAGSMFGAVKEYKVTISPSDFPGGSYAANNGVHKSTAVAADESTIIVEWTSNQIMTQQKLIQGQKNNAYIYNAASWGTVKSVTINDNVNFTSVIGASAQPTEAATGGFFKIKAGSATSKASSIVIVFEADADVPVLKASDVALGSFIFEGESGSKEASVEITASNLTEAIAVSTTSGKIALGATSVAKEGGVLNFTVNSGEGEINETITLQSGDLVATFAVTGHFYAKVKNPGTPATFEAGPEYSQGGDSTLVNGDKAVKVGTSSNAGSAIISLPANAVKLHFMAAAWNGKACTMTLSTEDATLDVESFDLIADAGIAGTSPFYTAEGDLSKYQYTVNISEAKGDISVVATATGTNKRFVIWDVTYEFEEPAGCDWDAIEFFNVGLAPEDENYNQFKICKAGENPNIVNIQVAPWADNNKGIYINFPSAEFTTISLPEGQYKVEGAGILLYLTAFTAKETEVTINYKGEDCFFTVYNAKASATAIDNTVVSEKAIKMFENGQLIIIKNGVKYNALGSVIE